MTKHPFNVGTKLAKVFTILSDGEWHCGKHELPGTQPAKAIQIIRQHGFSIENSTRLCSRCKDKTVHRRLISTTPHRLVCVPRFVRQGVSVVGVVATAFSGFSHRPCSGLALPSYDLNGGADCHGRGGQKTA